MQVEPGKSPREGLLCGIGAYLMWGLVPIYFHALADVSPLVVLCHRVLWSSIFLGLLISFRGEWSAIIPLFTGRRHLALLSLGAILIALNWLIFIYAVSTQKVLQASLGYFMNPLLSIALGMLFLGERLRRLQWVAVSIALAAVVNLAVRGEGWPWISIGLAVSFGLYGLVRKKVNVNSLHGLLVETVILLPPAIFLLATAGQGANAGKLGLLSLSGLITAVPLLLFGAAVRRLTLSTMGFLQYIGPSIQLCVAIFVFREPLDPPKLASFGLCWIAIAVYVLDSILCRLPQPVADRPE